MCTISSDNGQRAVSIHKEKAAVSELLRTNESAKALIDALRTAAAITPYYTETTPPQRL